MARAVPLAVASVLLLAAVSSCATTARINDVYTALDSAGERRRNIFFTDSKEIHCVVEMGIGRPGVTVEGIIRSLQSYDFENDRYFEQNRVLANAENSPQRSTGIQLLDIVLRPAGPDGADAAGQPFPPGRFVCEVSLDGELAKTAIFNVAFPDCPTASIRTGTQCFGFYKNLDVCPKYGLSSGDDRKCRCNKDKGWECDPG
jgi:hypothetical protein